MHLLECADCRDIVGDAVRSAPAIPWPRPVPRPLPVKVVVIGGGLLAAAAAALFIVRIPHDSDSYVPEMAALVQAVGTSRPIAPRLSGGFQYGSPPSPTRGAQASPSLAIAGAAESLRRAAQRTTGPMADAATGVASLFLNDSSASVAALRRAAGASTDARIHSDLAAALAVHAELTGDKSELSEAVDAADSALRRQPDLHEALFNRALALEGLKSPEAGAAWQQYLRHDSKSPWADEARRRAEGLNRGPGKQ